MKRATMLEHLACSGLLLAAFSVPVKAQAGAASLPMYDVATFRVNASDQGEMGMTFKDATFKADNTTLKMLFQWAFNVRQDLIFGLPGWAEKTHYDVNAKSVDADPAQIGKLTEQQRRAMARVLLEQRLQMHWHYETRTLLAYQLVEAKGGARLTRATAADEAKTGMMENDTEIQGTNMTLANLGEALGGVTGRTVVDKTALPGRYNIDLHWRPDGSAGADDGTKGSGEAGATLFTALQEQLGLRLQSSHDPVRVLVIDHIEQPTAN